MSGNLWQHYVNRAAAIARQDNHPDRLPDADAWATLRPEVHRQFMISLGLEHLPPRCALNSTETGTFSGEGYTARKIAYQLLPDVWGSAHVYRPAALEPEATAPAVLYTCGHHSSGVIGYQHHAIAWARRGYICLVFDTIEQHDNPGEHHGLSRGRIPRWISLGYTGAGGEVFNGMRALDLLLQQPGVDPKRIGVTGISGGGSQSFRLAAADDRLCAVATVAGVSDPAFAIANHTVQQHCDCMYDHNRFARDISVWASLIAPRPLLYGFARHDNLYTPEEFQAIYRHSRARYEKLGHGDMCQLEEYDGPHGYNHKATCDAIHAWFDRHVAGRPHPAIDTLAIAQSSEIHDEPTLSVFHGVTPEPNRLNLLPDLLSRRGQVRLPQTPAEWSTIRGEAIDRLRNEVFHLIDDVTDAKPLHQYGDWTYTGVDRFAWRGELEGMAQQVVQVAPSSVDESAVLIGMGGRHEDAIGLAAEMLGAGDGRGISALAIEPRGAFRTAFLPAQERKLNREGCLVGMTPTMLMVQDLHHLMPQITALPRVADRAIYLYGRGEAAVAMLYHALMNPRPAFKGIILQDLPRSHDDGAYPILGILPVMDLAHAVGLLAPLPVILISPSGTSFDWYWAHRAHARLTNPTTLHGAADLGGALAAMAPWGKSGATATLLAPEGQ